MLVTLQRQRPRTATQSPREVDGLQVKGRNPQWAILSTNVALQRTKANQVV